MEKLYDYNLQSSDKKNGSQNIHSCMKNGVKFGRNRLKKNFGGE